MLQEARARGEIPPAAARIETVATAAVDEIEDEAI